MSSAARTSPGRRSGRQAADDGRVTPSRATRRRTASIARPTTPLLTTTPRWLPAAAVLAGPALGALLGQAIGGYHGPLFALLTVTAAALATAAATPNGRWWVVPAQPPITWLTAAAAELAWHNPPYADTKAKAVGLVHATTHAFPVILIALAAMALVIVVDMTRGRRGGARRA